MLIAVVASVMQLVAAPCAASPVQDNIPGIGSARGVDGAWVVTADQWSAGPTKTLWVFPTVQGPLRIEGRELATGAKARFEHRGREEQTGEAIAIENPRRESVAPGGDWNLLKDYLYITSYVFYPTRGCYQFDIAMGEARKRITVELK